MKTILNPDPGKWDQLCKRPAIEARDLEKVVREIMGKVKAEGDEALLELTRKFDFPSAEGLVIGKNSMAKAGDRVPENLKAAIRRAKENIETFHKAQFEPVKKIETSPGVTCWRKSLPIERVGLYIPGGTAPLFSTLLMLAVPARIAGCSKLVVCTPLNQDGEVHPAILFTAMLLGIEEICTVGGAQAVAAMTYGTASIPQVDKIFGPGNQYVTQAKVLAQQEGVAMDLPAGPSELLVVADVTANPAFVAADLLSQAEHGADSQVILLSDSLGLVEQVQAELERQVSLLPREKIAREALESSRAIVLENLSEAMTFSNQYAPEHLILAVENPALLAVQVLNAGSVFMGHYTPESAGDYASGTNHTLPTNGAARSYSGVSLDSFLKKITFQEITPQGILDLGPTIEAMAEAELLEAHRNAVSLRLDALQKPEPNV